LRDANSANAIIFWGALCKLKECKVIDHAPGIVVWVFDNSCHGNGTLIRTRCIFIVITQHDS
jgi:hypothetical protein